MNKLKVAVIRKPGEGKDYQNYLDMIRRFHAGKFDAIEIQVIDNTSFELLEENKKLKELIKGVYPQINGELLLSPGACVGLKEVLEGN